MSRLILVICFLVGSSSFSQDSLPIKNFCGTMDYLLNQVDSLDANIIIGELSIGNYNPASKKSNPPISNSTCLVRGHILSGGTVTLAYCTPKIIDADCHTEIHVDWCNSYSSSCSRCHEVVSRNGYKYFDWQSENCTHE